MNYGGLFDSEEKEKRLKELDDEMKHPNFWNDKKNSEKVIAEFNELKRLLDGVTDLKNNIEGNLELLSLDEDNEVLELLSNDIEKIESNLKEQKVLVLLNGKYDKEGAILEIHPGAGGTESCDWANMLYRMYQRYCDKKGYKYEVIDEQAGDEAGIKSVTLIIKGLYAYGYLKAEKGVHRLVRISPFDSNSRRHTSFASVSVSPYFESKNISIEVF